MDTVLGLMANGGKLLGPWLSEIATAMVACSILVLSADINHFIRRGIGARSFITRTFIFVVVNAFCYGLLIVSISPWLAKQLGHLAPQWLLTAVISAFIFIGAWAQRNRQI